MYKSILVILLAGLLAAPAIAVPPGDNPDTPEIENGWGQCETWQKADGYDSGFGLHNHIGWHMNWDDPFDPNVFDEWMVLGSIELWIELYAQMTCHNIHWQFHRITDNQVYIYFYVYGYVYSNSLINVDVDGGNLVFQDDKFGPNAGDNGPQIPVYYAYASGPYIDGGVYPDGDAPRVTSQQLLGQMYNQWTDAMETPFCIEVGPCDWWWGFIGYACIPYHTEDGYYKLEMTVCPMPWL